VASLPDLPYHDAEILHVSLDREGPTVDIDLELFAQLPEARVVRLRFIEVSEVELGDFNGQNVLFDLLAEPRPGDRLGIALQSSYGLGGSFECSGVELVAQ
jgi:hypothetical protein